MTNKIAHKALVVVADGAGAKYFRNTRHENKIALTPDGHYGPSNLDDEGPAGRRPPESSEQETDEAIFAKQLAKELFRRAHSGDFEAIVLIAEPQTLPTICCRSAVFPTLRSLNFAQNRSFLFGRPPRRSRSTGDVR